MVHRERVLQAVDRDAAGAQSADVVDPHVSGVRTEHGGREPAHLAATTFAGTRSTSG